MASPSEGSHEPVVLLVEDHADSREALTELLESYGFAVVAESNAESAMRALDGGLHPCAIILDVRLPMISGLDLWRYMQTVPALAAIPVIAVSGDLDALKKGAGLGIHYQLLKPAEPREIFELVAKHCRRGEHGREPDRARS